MMSWGMVAGAVIAGGVSAYSADKSASASKSAANTSAGYQMAGLDYLKDKEAAPMFYRDQALAALAAEYGLSAAPEVSYEPSTRERQNRYAGSGSIVDLVNRVDAADKPQPMIERYSVPTGSGAPVGGGITDRAMNSPLYNAIMSGRNAGEQSIARSSNATGGLRGGQSVSDLAEFNKDLQNQALMESRNDIIRGLGTFAGMPSMAPQIANQYSNIGNTLAQGQVAAAQARQQGISGVSNAIGTGIQAYYGSKI